jgi:hypothetical protein
VRQTQQLADIGLEKPMRSDKTGTSSIKFSIPALNTGCEADSFEA